MVQSLDRTEFETLLERIQSDFDFETGFYHDAYLERRIKSRMRRTGTKSFREYNRYLQDDPTEAEALLDALSITVTHFFRNPEMWERLRPILRSITSDSRRPRIWSAPCADGREPYSIAMLALDDDRVTDRRLSILGTDINPDALAHARRGQYRTTRTADIGAELAPLDDITQFVSTANGTFQVRDPVKRIVEFDRHDLIREQPPGTFELILCRNLLIYIDESYKEPIFETLVSALEPGGYLVIGMTETLPRSFRDRFEAIDQGTRIYQVT